VAERQVRAPAVSGVRVISSPPKIYRIYCYDATVRNVSSDLIEATNDEAAIAAVSELGFGSKCEIWEDTRMVAQFDGEHRAA